MKILIIGGTGTIGRKVSAHFIATDEVIVVGRTTPNISVEITNTDSIREMFERVGKVDAIISIVGEAKWKPFEDLSEEDFYVGIKSKLMGQVNIVRIGKEYLNENGSFTLTTGVLADDPVYMTTAAAMVNGGIHSFVLAAALEMKNGQRINVVSPDYVEDAYEKYKDFFPGHNCIPMRKVVNGYVRSVKGKGNGEIIRIYE
ncbi:short chain dehydrogenase [Aureivirga sp. CE67]|uniref:short chain dehydrogenase n=1 Tax=Aureivirga sp. CE67 TaxID=1788983 RepID=UPI0018C9539F|nr:short chain dehydrogenase [Aureivirga sp. CE67]